MRVRTTGSLLVLFLSFAANVCATPVHLWSHNYGDSDDQYTDALQLRLNPQVESDASVRQRAWEVLLQSVLPKLPIENLQAMADRFTYVPMTGLLIVVVWGSWDFAQRTGTRREVYVLAGVAVPDKVEVNFQIVTSPGADTISVKGDRHLLDHVSMDDPGDLSPSHGLPEGYNPATFNPDYPK